MALQKDEKFVRHLNNSFNYMQQYARRENCERAIQNIKGARIDLYRENGGWTLQINATTEQAADDAYQLIKLSRFN